MTSAILSPIESTIFSKKESWFIASISTTRNPGITVKKKKPSTGWI
jgi:hypothetical protein